MINNLTNCNDEINRLREENERLRATVEGYPKHFVGIAKENERLRATIGRVRREAWSFASAEYTLDRVKAALEEPGTGVS